MISIKKSENWRRRALDAVLSGTVILFLLPLLVAVALAIIAVEGRPVFFHQIRVGRSGQRFVIYKYRTMTVSRYAAKGSYEAGDISRVTPFGRILRKAKIDELPQMWNVLRGEMSFVGPRPEVPKWVAAYPDRWARVLVVTPGITDPASIFYRNEEELLSAADDPEHVYRDIILPHKLDIYEDYARGRTLFRDLCLIGNTIRALIAPRKQYAVSKIGTLNFREVGGNQCLSSHHKRIK